jgi:hypothetical protein
MANATTIILKYGNGEPAKGQLVQGELGVDISGKKLWTYNGQDNIILSGAELDIGDLPDIELPDGTYITLEVLAGMVVQNTADIEELEDKVDANTDAVNGNITQVSLLADRVAALEIWQEAHEEAVGNLLIELDRIEEIATGANDLAEANEEAIELLKDELGLIEAGLQYAGNYNATSGLIESVSAWADSLGVQKDQPLQNFVGNKGLYFIVTTEGELKNVSPNVNGETAYKGDWLICDGTQYLLANYQMETVTFGDLAGMPLDNAELADEFAKYLKKDGDTLEGGTYSNTKSYMQKMAEAKK